MRAIFDTNLLIDYLNGIPAAKEEFSLYTTKIISIISYIEVLVGINSEHHDAIIPFLKTFQIIPVDLPIAQLSVEVRKIYKFKIPDAIIFATTQQCNAILVTRNTKDFKSSIPIVRIPYEI